MAKGRTGDFAVTLLRVVLGMIFTYHGYSKLFVPGGFLGTVGFFTGLGIPLPAYSALLVAVVEFVGGLFLILGLLTRYTSLFLLADMLVAFFVVHLKQGFKGYEFVLILMAALVVIISVGPGKLAAGRALRNKHLH